MTLSDEDFREAHKPVHVPAHFDDAHTAEEKVIFALGQIGRGTAHDVQNYISNLSTDKIDAEDLLKQLFAEGRINGQNIAGQIQFDLSKITTPNDGAVNPDLLAPGLD